MKTAYFIFIGGIATLGILNSCTKNTNPPLPIHDTTVVIKTDTLTKTDTLKVPPPPDPTVNLKKGLLLYLPFDGNIADSSGNNNPTVAVGGNVLTADAHGYANNAFGGNGGQRVVVTNNGSITFDTAFSLSYDVMINAPARQGMVTMTNETDGTGPSFVSSTSAPGIYNFVFYVNDVSIGCGNYGLSQAQNPAEVEDTSIVPLTNTWYNVISIYHKGAVQTYINGQLSASMTSTGTAALVCPSSKVIIGGWWDGDPIPLNGKMDEVRLYNRVLTPHEIVALSQHYQVTSEKANPGLRNGKSSH
jgi:hypothetical protein